MVAVRYRLASYNDDEDLCASTTVSIAALDNTHDPLKYRKEDITLGDDFHSSLHGVKGLVRILATTWFFLSYISSAAPSKNWKHHEDE